MTIAGISLTVLSMVLLLGKEPGLRTEPLSRGSIVRIAVSLFALALGALALVRALGVLEGLLVASTALCTAASLVPVLRSTYPKTALALALSLLLLSLLGQYA